MSWYYNTIDSQKMFFFFLIHFIFNLMSSTEYCHTYAFDMNYILRFILENVHTILKRKRIKYSRKFSLFKAIKVFSKEFLFFL